MSKLRNLGSKCPSSALTTVVHGVVRRRAVLDELAVAPVGHTLGGGAVPEIAPGRAGDGIDFLVPLGGIGRLLLAAVAERPGPFDVVGGVRPHGPFVPVGADLAFDVEVVEQHELADQGVMVGRHLRGEEAEARLAVALGEVAEDLVVGPVLLDDVDAVRDRRRQARLERDRVPLRGFRAGDGGRVVLLQRANSRRPFASSAPSPAESGIGMIESVPWKRPPMYSRVLLSVPPAASGFGPSRLAFDEAPLPLAT